MEVKFSLSKKLLIGFGLVIGLFIISSVVTFSILTRNDTINRRLSEQNTPSVNGLIELQNLITESKLLIKNWVYIDKLPDTPDKNRLVELHNKLYPELMKEISPLAESWSDADREIFSKLSERISQDLFKNHKEAGICVFKNSFDGKLTMQSIRLFSINAFRISPSPDVLVVSEPLASTKPACPLGAK